MQDVKIRRRISDTCVSSAYIFEVDTNYCSIEDNHRYRVQLRYLALIGHNGDFVFVSHQGIVPRAYYQAL